MAEKILKKNIIANVFGNGWTALVSIIFIPVYIHYLGIEAFGLIGFFTTLLALLSIMDFGLSSAINRELAQLSVTPDRHRDMREVVNTLEAIYWGLAVAIGFCVFAASGWISENWFPAYTLPAEIVQESIMLMGAVLAFRWPYALYAGGINGLQKQVQYNTLKIGLESVRAVGAVAILKFYSPTVQAYFVWQIFVSIAGTASAAFVLRRNLPAVQSRFSFSLPKLRKIWKFAAGLSGITFLATILLQMDKVILSKILSLEEFGYYALASTAALGLNQVTVPIVTAFYPQFSQLAATQDRLRLAQLYHRGCQLLSVLILPTALVITFFSEQILFIWSGSALTAERAHLVLSILVLGMAWNGLLNIPYALQLAHGWTSLALWLNAASLALLTPIILLLVKNWGAAGGAFSSIILNAGYMFVGIYFMHRRLLKGEIRQWYLTDILKPLAAALSVVVAARLVSDGGGAPAAAAAYIVLVYMLALIGAAFSAPEIRLSIIRTLYSFRTGGSAA